MKRFNTRTSKKQKLQVWGFSGGSSGGSGGPAANQGPALNSNGQPVGNSGSGGQPQSQAAPQPQPTAEQTAIQSLGGLFGPKPGVGVGPDQPARKGIFSEITDEALVQAASGLSVQNRLNPDMVRLASGGNPEQAQALMGLLDQVFQASVVNATKNGIKLTEHGVQTGLEAFRGKDLPEYMTQYNVQQGLRDANPLLASPEIKPFYDTLVKGFTAQYPNATPQDIAKHAEEQLGHLATVLGSGKDSKNKSSFPGNQQNRVKVTSLFDDNFLN